MGGEFPDCFHREVGEWVGGSCQDGLKVCAMHTISACLYREKGVLLDSALKTPQLLHMLKETQYGSDWPGSLVWVKECRMWSQ